MGAWGAVSAPSPCSPPSPGHFHPHLHLTKFLSQAPRASLALQDPKTSKTVGKCKSKVGGGGGGMSPASYQHLLAQLDEDEDAGVYHLLALDRPVLEGQVLAFLIQEET